MVKSNVNIEQVNELWENRVTDRLVRTENGCMEWQGATAKGYGQIRVSEEGESYLVQTHRIAVMVKEGRVLKSSELACHICDNPKCCNPEHLFVGTQSDNMKDAYRKGRLKNTFVKKQKILAV